METMPHIPVSWGEVIDKVTILEIKEQNIAGEAALVNIRKELAALRSIIGAEHAMPGQVSGLTDDLRAVNRRLWDLEDLIRIKERLGAFDEEFIRLARSIYVENDQRSKVKRAINELTGSELVEEKSYEK
jgi:Family of unknown function (DUF6165)